MIEEPPLLKIKKTRLRPTTAQIEAFRNVQAGNVVDAMYGQGALSNIIKPVTAFPAFGESVVGPALTAENSPADILASFAAPHYIQPGDILVAGFMANQSCATAGDRLCGMLKNAGSIAMISDGPVRDIHGITDIEFPVWATGLTPASPFMTGPGRIGFPLQMGGQQVCSGDIVVADRDGVVIVPFDEIDRVIKALVKIKALEIELSEKVVGGLITPEKVLAIINSPRTAVTDE